MITGITDSKKHFFIWNIVTIAIFAAFFFGFPYLFELVSEKSPSISTDMSETMVIFGIKFSVVLLYALICYAIATYPMGFYVRRKFLKKYIHVPTERIKPSEGFTNPIAAFFRIMQCLILTAINIILLAFNLIVSALVGIVIYPYQLISGIILLITGKM